jgi:hypothetical protein
MKILADRTRFRSRGRRLTGKLLGIGTAVTLGLGALTTVTAGPAAAGCGRSYSYNRTQVQIDNCPGSGGSWAWVWADSNVNQASLTVTFVNGSTATLWTSAGKAAGGTFGSDIRAYRVCNIIDTAWHTTRSDCSATLPV